MAVKTVDSTNYAEFMQGGEARVDTVEAPTKVVEAKDGGLTIKTDVEPEAKEETPEKVEKEAVKAADDDIDDGLDEKERAELKESAGAKTEKVRRQLARKHAAMKDAEERRADAEAFAETQYRERMAAIREAEELRAQLKAADKSKSAPPEEKEPQLEDFDDAKSYAKALVKFEFERDRAQRAEAEAKAAFAAKQAQVAAREEAYAEEHPEYRERVATVLGSLDTPLPDYIQEHLMSSDLGPALMDHFANDVADFKRIVKLSPIAAIAALGKLEGKLEQPKEPAKAKAEPEPKVEPKAEAKAEAKPAERSKAPPPIAPVSGTSAPVQKDLRDMTTRETIEYWAARDKASASRRKRH